MPRPVISVENLSKAYRIGLKDEIPDTLMGAMKNVATAPWRNFHRLRRLDTATAPQSPLPDHSSPLPNPQLPLPAPPPESDTLWALRDVSFEVNEGDVVGIIGRNGAGKSTLLKILSRITEPTSGRAVIRGRVSSLLEVGTGFHPELTGRENIYMNGTILGMTKREIDRKFDEIVAFSGVEKFLDTPTKRYSSGMQVRLAFAVAAHLEPEILIVDEVLAVGDAEFQQKCLGKMQEVACAGRSVLFVSHNMAAIQTLCSRGILLKEGTSTDPGPIRDVVNLYLQANSRRSTVDAKVRKDRRGSGPSRLQLIRIYGENGPASPLMTGGAATFEFEISRPLRNIGCSFTIYDSRGIPLTNFSTAMNNKSDALADGTRNVFTCKIRSLPLRPGSYRINVAIELPSQIVDHLESAATFHVQDGTFDGRRSNLSNKYGAVWIPHVWATQGARPSFGTATPE